MKTGEHYYCRCGAELEVLKACTCKETQEMICTCGMPMTQKTMETQESRKS